MIENWQAVHQGITLTIGIQFFISAILLFYRNQLTERLLGFIAIITGIGFLEHLFWPFIDDAILLQLIFSGKKIIFIPALFFLAIVSQSIKKIRLVPHLIFPILYSSFFSIISLSYSSYQEYRSYFQVFNMSIYAIYFSGYLWWSWRYYYPKTKYKKRVSLFRVFVWYALFSLPFVWISALFAWIYLSFPLIDFSWAPNFLLVLAYINNLAFIPLLLLFFSYVRLDFGAAKKKQIPTEAFQNIDQAFIKIIEEQLYLEPDFKLSTAEEILGLPAPALSEFCLQKNNKTFRAFINQLRLDAFKSMALSHENQSQYSIEGMAKSSGFKSRATFYRYFKEIEGISPSQFLDALKSQKPVSKLN